MLIREHELGLTVLDIDVARDIFSGVLCDILAIKAFVNFIASTSHFEWARGQQGLDIQLKSDEVTIVARTRCRPGGRQREYP